MVAGTQQEEMRGALIVVALLMLSLASASAETAAHNADEGELNPVFDQYAALITSVLMQKFSSPENATKVLANLVHVTGAHIDALDAQGKHDLFRFNYTAFMTPPFVQNALDFTQSISEAVAEWLPDHIGLEHFANNVTQAYQPGVTTTETLFRYAPCIIGNHPAGADIYATAISITPLGIYDAPEGMNVQPEGIAIVPSLMFIAGAGMNVKPQGANIAPALISISPIRSQVGAAGFEAAPVRVAVGLAGPNAQAASTLPVTLP